MSSKIWIVWLICTLPVVALSAQNAVLTGKITDAATGEALGFATVALPELQLGAIANADGFYRVVNIPSGAYLVRVSYTGYQSQERVFTFESGGTYALDLQIGEASMSVSEVVISAQAQGQQAAINQQINSNTIVNVISKEKLQELPDQNAAEAIGRLAGVSVQRDAGEGQRVVIRGLSPRFASVTINGERIPSTDGDDRSVDLSMVSPDMLAGVELFKAIRPDMDGDAVGGTVNFSVKKADKGFKGEGRLFGGYNGLSEKFGPWRSSATMSNRFLDNRFGVILTANYQEADRSSHDLGGNYYFSDIVNDSAIIRAASVTLTDQIELRKRAGASATLDYQLDKGFIVANSFWGYTRRDALRRRRSFRSAEGQMEYSIREFNQNTNLWANSLSGEHYVGPLTFSWRGSYSQTLQDMPWSLDMRFRETAALTADHDDSQGPDILVLGYKNDLNRTLLHDTRFTTQSVSDYNATIQADLRYDIKPFSWLNGYLKAGVKYRQNGRERDNTQIWSQPYLPTQNYPGQNPDLFLLDNNKRAYMINFLGDYTNPGFLNGRFELMPANSPHFVVVGERDMSMYNAFWGTNYQPGDTLRYDGLIDMDKVRAYFERYRMEYDTNKEVDAQDYLGVERIRAGYLMSELNLGKRLMLMGGLRYEKTGQDYRSVSFAMNDPEDGDAATQRPPVDVRAASGYREWLPMVHLRYKITPWWDVRLAATKSLNRPDFFNLVPWEITIPQNPPRISRGRPDLRHTTAWNYDAFMYFYNRYGLLTVGGFYKRLANVDVQSRSTIISGPFAGYQLNQPINLPGATEVRGLEVDFQSNLRSLRGWWKGIIVGANVTLVRSSTQVPFFDIRNYFDPVTPPFFFTEVIDTVRAGRAPGQANFIANLQLGYEWQGFSGRVSMGLQENSLAQVGERAELDAFTDRSVRWDLAIQQKINKRWAAFFNLNNISNQPEAAFVGRRNLISEREFFGMTGEVGLRFKW
ncbi:MAG: TonB-dependent receptor [Saprospiraceae bacterium]